jgi:putative component of membrane protein insertase Oxa1/YidC/SpoIIIJ protein YidD
MNAVATGIGPSLGAWLFASAVGGYQRHLSPWKGFRCAYRVRHGRPSCSEFAKRVALRRGLAAVPELLRERFQRCAAAAKALAHRRTRADEAGGRKRKPPTRSSSTDGCSADLGGCDAPCNAGAEVLTSCDLGGADACDVGCGGVDISI